MKKYVRLLERQCQNFIYFFYIFMTVLPGKFVVAFLFHYYFRLLLHVFLDSSHDITLGNKNEYIAASKLNNLVSGYKRT